MSYITTAKPTTRSTTAAVLIGLVIILSFLVWRNLAPHQMRLFLGAPYNPDHVEIIMTCREPLIAGDGVCLPEGHIYRGEFEAWVE